MRWSVAISAALHGGFVAWFGTHEFAVRRAEPEPSTIAIELVEPPPARTSPSASVEPAPAATSSLTADSPTDSPADSPADAPALEPPRRVRQTGQNAVMGSDPFIENASGEPDTSRADRTIDNGYDARVRQTGQDAVMGSDPFIENASGNRTSEPPGRASEPPSRPNNRSKYFDVRRGERADLTLPAREIEDVPEGTAPQPGVKPSGILSPDGTGRKSDQSPFVAKVSRDGGVTFHDKPDVDIELAMPTPKIIGRGIAEWYLSDKGPDGKRGKRTLEQYVGGSIDGGDAAGIDKGDRSGTIIISLFRGNLSPIDWIMRKTVGDPYSSRKRDFLDKTREERAEMRARHRTQLLSQTHVLMRDNCERAWASSTEPQKRKQALFDLWDEIVDDGSDPELAEATRAARAHVIGFIRARLPQQSEGAYTPDEIRALVSRKQSSATFSPYE